MPFRFLALSSNLSQTVRTVASSATSHLPSSFPSLPLTPEGRVEARRSLPENSLTR